MTTNFNLKEIAVKFKKTKNKNKQNLMPQVSYCYLEYP